MARTGSTSGDDVRRRPKDRKAQIARASAAAFSALGYYGVSMETIASRVGISATALYRHYSSKYELFRDAVLGLGQQLVDCTAFAGGAATGDPEQILYKTVAALVDTAMANREAGALYRWEGRYLRGDDQATLIAQMRTVHRRIQLPLSRIRPELTSRQRWTLSTAMLSVIGSIVDHRAKLPAIQVRALLAELADAVLAAEVPDVEDGVGDSSPSGSAVVETSKYEALLNESLRLFNLKGYRDTSMEDIAAAVGMPASGIYKYFSGKSDILAAAFRRAADRLSADLSTILNTVSDREDALTAVIDAYVTRSFDQPELDYVYYTRAAQHDTGGPEDSAQPAAVDRGVVGGTGGVGPAGVDTRAGAVRRPRSDVAGDRSRPADALSELGADPRDGGTAAGSDAAGPLPVARYVAGQVGQIADRPDNGQAPGLPCGESETECRFDAAVEAKMLAAVTWERLFRDPVEQPRGL